MRSKIAIAILAFVFLLAAQAGELSCDIFEAVQGLSRENQDKFWANLQRLTEGKALTSHTARRLLDELKKKDQAPIKPEAKDLNAAGSASGAQSSPMIKVLEKRKAQLAPYLRQPAVQSKRALEAVQDLTPALRKHYAELLDILAQDPTGHELYKNPGRWGFEKLKISPTTHTVRLSHGYRVEIEIKEGLPVTIRDVGKHVGGHGH